MPSLRVVAGAELPAGHPLDDRQLVRNILEDLKANGGDWGHQGFWVMVVYRFGRWHRQLRSHVLRKALAIPYRFSYKLVQIITGIELPCETRVGRNFVIDHFGEIIICGYATFGDTAASETESSWG